MPLLGNSNEPGAIPVALADPSAERLAELQTRLAGPVEPRLCDEATLDELLNCVIRRT